MTKITQWPIIEASLSPKPVDPRNRAIAMKALMDESPQDEGTASGTLVTQTAALVSSAADLCERYRSVAGAHPLNAAKREAIKAAAESFARLHDATAPRPDPELVLSLKKRLLQARIGS